MINIVSIINADKRTVNFNKKRLIISKANKQTKMIHNLLTLKNTLSSKTARIETHTYCQQTDLIKSNISFTLLIYSPDNLDTYKSFLKANKFECIIYIYQLICVTILTFISFFFKANIYKSIKSRIFIKSLLLINSFH